MEKELPGLSYLNAAYSLFITSKKTLIRKLIRDQIGPLLLMILTITLWTIWRPQSDKDQQKPQLTFETNLSIEPLCQTEGKISGVLLNQRDDPCILLSGVELACPSKTIALKFSDLKQLPFQQMKRLNHIKFIEKSPKGISLCKNVRKISFESW